MSKEAYYFSHDANARSDPKSVELLSVYGYEGYGWYWALVEMMREQKEYRLDHTSKYFYHGLANELLTTVERVQGFVEDCVNEFKLFKKDGTYLWSESLLNRMLKYKKMVEQRKMAGIKSAQKRAKNKVKSTPVEQPLNNRITTVQQLKEIKLNKIKGNKEEILACMELLLNIPGYPLMEKDADNLDSLISEYPEIHPICLIKNWIDYLEKHPLTEKSIPRSQLRNQFETKRKHKICVRPNTDSRNGIVDIASKEYI